MAINWASGIMGFAGRMVNPQPLYSARPAVTMPAIGRPQALHATELYRILRAYYGNNGLYDAIQDMLRRQGVWREGLKGLRNPTYRVTEFHAGHLWPGTLPQALPIQADNPDIVAPIQQIWKWSNWGANKQVAARHLGLFGDWFVKVATTTDRTRVFMQNIEPEHVTDFDADERDVLTYVRFDVPIKKRMSGGEVVPYLHTEEWSTDTGLFRVWETQTQATSFNIVDVAELGQPIRQQPIESFGIDFVPVVHAKFADTGEDRGWGAVVPALDKIDEANRQATRLAQLLFRNNDVFWALRANSVDAAGRPLPPPQLKETDGTTDDDGTVQLGSDRILKLPGMSELQSLVPDLNYESALHILQDQMGELEQDLPELTLYRIRDMGANISGRAVRLMLAPAIARLTEARGNAEHALARADQMGLTIGQKLGLWDVGTYEHGDLEHCFEERDVLPNDELERAQAEQADATAIAQLVAATIPVEMAAARVYGWSDERAAQFTVDKVAAIQREQTLAAEDVEPEVEQ
jgi:hypothetical protein